MTAGDAEQPRYQRAMAALREQIERGLLTPGARLPGERELARDFDVSPMTMHRALAELAREGLLVRHVGRGTFVAERRNGAAGPPRVTLALQYDVAISEDDYLGGLYRGIQEVALREGVELSFARVEDGRYEALLRERRPHGLLLLHPEARMRPALERLSALGARFVALGASWSDASLPCVDSDNAEGIRQAVRYLHRLGHRRIGGVFAALQSTNTRDRQLGFRSGLEACGLEVRADWQIEGPSHGMDLGPEGVVRLQALALSPDGPTAFICAGYYLALHTARILQALRLRVPDRVSLIGFDDPVSAAHLTPALTTVRQPLAEMGARAMERLVARIRGAPPAGTERLPTEVVIRESCAPPPD